MSHSRVGVGVTPFQTDDEATIRLAVGRRGARLRAVRGRRGLDPRCAGSPRAHSRRHLEDRARDGRAPGVEPQPGGDRHGRGEPAARVGRALRPRPRREQPAARRRPARDQMAGTGEPDAHHARRRQGAARGRSTTARPRARETAPARLSARAAHPDLSRGTGPRLGSARGRARGPVAPVPLGSLEALRRPRPARRGRGDWRGFDADRRRRERPARDSGGRGDCQADRRRLAARLYDAHGPDLSPDAARRVRLCRRGRRAARGQHGRRAAASCLPQPSGSPATSR